MGFTPFKDMTPAELAVWNRIKARPQPSPPNPEEDNSPLCAPRPGEHAEAELAWELRRGRQPRDLGRGYGD